jgi:hypothetical protein
MHGPDWRISEHLTLKAPALSVLLFHSDYYIGKQGGVELILHDQRVATNGALSLAVAPQQWNPLPTLVGQRRRDDAGTSLSLELSVKEPELRYIVALQPSGEAVLLRVDLDKPLPAQAVGRMAFLMEFCPGAYIGRTWRLGGGARLAAGQGRQLRRRGAPGAGRAQEVAGRRTREEPLWDLVAPAGLGRGVGASERSRGGNAQRQC